MKCIMLDVDGVIIPTDPARWQRVTLPDGRRTKVSPVCVQALNWLCQESGATIVVSSTWRDFGYRKVCTLFLAWGIAQPPYSLTPRSIRDWTVTPGYCTTRGEEIQWWLALQQERREPVERFVILDDDDDMEELAPFLVRTDHSIGLTLRDAERALHVLQCQG